jgi:hypothetical protein
MRKALPRKIVDREQITALQVWAIEADGVDLARVVMVSHVAIGR